MLVSSAQEMKTVRTTREKLGSSDLPHIVQTQWKELKQSSPRRFFSCWMTFSQPTFLTAFLISLTSRLLGETLWSKVCSPQPLIPYFNSFWPLGKSEANHWGWCHDHTPSLEQVVYLLSNSFQQFHCLMCLHKIALKGSKFCVTAACQQGESFRFLMEKSLLDLSVYAGQLLAGMEAQSV